MLFVLIAAAWLVLFAVAWRRRPADRGQMVRDLVVIAAFVPVTIAFFWRPILTQGVWVPRGGGDLVSFLYPVYAFAAASIQHGVLPLWNPYLYSGSPFAADIQSGIFYPINVLTFLTIRPFTYLTIEELSMLSFFLAATFMYLYARTLSLSPLPSFAAGTIFGFGGFMTAHLGHLNMIAAAAWLPLILLFFHKAVTKGSLTAAMWAGAAYGLSILAGHTQISLYIGFTIGLYWLWYLIPASKTSGLASAGAVPPRLRRVAVLLVVLVVGLATSAIQLLPSYELATLSVRADLTYANSTQFSASPTGLITLIIPHFFGDDPSAFWGLKWSLTEVYGYVGIMPPLLAALAIWLRKKRQGIVLFFGVLAVLSILLSLGDYTVLHGWLYRFVPGFDKVRSAGRFVFLFDFSIAVLAAFGLQALGGSLMAQDRPKYRLFLHSTTAVLFGSGFIAVPFFYYALMTSQNQAPVILQRIEGIIDSMNLSLVFLAASVAVFFVARYLPRGRRTLQYVSLAVIIIDIFSANAGFNPTTQDIFAGFDHPEAVSFLQNHGAMARVDSVTNVWDVWQPDITLLNQVDDVQGIFNPMLLADFNTFWNSLPSRSAAAYDILNTKYLVAHKNVTLDWTKFRTVFTDDPSVNIYQNAKAMPRAWLVPAAVVLPHDQIIKRLSDPSFDPKSVVYLERAVDGIPRVPVKDFRGQVLALSYPSPNEIMIRTESASPAILFVSDSYYPGWDGFIDGRHTDVLRANYAFKAVTVPAGAHQVRLVFEPRILTIGAILSGLAWLALLIIAIWTAANVKWKEKA